MARWPRQILFGDVDAMYASAARLAQPELHDHVLAVGTPPPRGIITSASYEARRFGVKAAMPSGQALRLCPELVIVPPDRALYRRLHARLRAVTDRLFPRPVWTSIDEFYADTTDLQSRYPDPARLAAEVKDALLQETGLPCTIAVASSMTTAKLAADASKPNGLRVIEPGHERAFLDPLPVRALPGIGPKTGAALEAAGLRQLADLLDPRFLPVLRSRFGSRLLALQARAGGEDGERVVGHASQSISRETTFDEETAELAVLQTALSDFLAALAYDLRQDGLAASYFTLKLKDRAFRVTTRQRRFPRPSNYDPLMWPAIRDALPLLLRPDTRYRLVGLALGGLVPAMGVLYDGRAQRAVAAMDAVIARHGAGVIRLGGLPQRGPTT